MKNDKYKLTRHHIVPRSRGGTTRDSNLKMVPRDRHEKYHTLFSNRTPEEIVDYLNKDFWNNRYEINISSLEKL